MAYDGKMFVGISGSKLTQGLGGVGHMVRGVCGGVAGEGKREGVMGDDSDAYVKYGHV